MIYKEKLNRKKNQFDKRTNMYKLRIWHKKGKGKHDPRVLVKCGCCSEAVEITYDEDEQAKFKTLEINGVIGSIEDWKKILLPLLGMKKK